MKIKTAIQPIAIFQGSLEKVHFVKLNFLIWAFGAQKPNNLLKIIYL